MRKTTNAPMGAGKRIALVGMSLAVGVSINSSVASADDSTPETLPEIRVEGQTINPAIFTVEPQYLDIAPYADGGELLRSIPGVDSGRMGGHGFEPVIRGQQQGRLNVIGDGAFQYGACPNRMDPPSSITGFDAYDEIVVERGYQSVTNGPGGSGGTITMERSDPDFLAGNAYEGTFSLGGDSNGSLKQTALDLSYDLGAGFARFDGGLKDAGNYKDASGNKVRSAYEDKAGTLELGWRPDALTALTVSQEMGFSRDVLFAGAGMDTPEADYRTTRLSFERTINDDTLRSVEFSAYGSMADHLMDNYSLRSYGMMTMKTLSTSDTFGGKISANLSVNDVDVVTGVDMQHNTRDATRYRGTSPTNVETIHAFVWPDLALAQAGLFAEGTAPLSTSSRLTVGGRYDYVNADAGKVDETASPTGAISRTANDLYEMYYGSRMKNETEHNLSALIRYEQDWGSDTSSYISASRSVRTADATERSMAGDHGTASSRWVGNPGIDPEKHYQLEVGGAASLNGWDMEAFAYHDWVRDYIFRDRARGQDGILLSDSATVYHNIDARLWGLEGSVSTRFGNNWILSANAAYTYGRNGETGLALPQIPPLSGMVDLAYDANDWTVGTRINAAMEQTRVDTDTSTGSGLDAAKTSGYVVPDIYGTYRGLEPVDIRFGITNLLDRDYANHLNRSNSFDTDQVQVKEPGRSFYVQVQVDF